MPTSKRPPTILAITAHPDDECFLFGGALAMHARNGGRVCLLCLTDGQAGRTGGLVAVDRLGALRRNELLRACAHLGIPEILTPGLADGALDEIGDEEGARIVREIIEEVGADVLLTFGPDGASGHRDHKACWRWTMAAARGERLYAATFPVLPDGTSGEPRVGEPLGARDENPDEPRGGKTLPVTTVVDVSALGDAKRRAFLEHRSQQDHLELFDTIMSDFDGEEYYHRVHPPWRDGDAVESVLLID